MEDLVAQLVEHPDFNREGSGFGKNFDRLLWSRSSVGRASRFLIGRALGSRKILIGYYDLVAQLVEHNTFNVGALGSSPSGITKLRIYDIVLSGVFFMAYCYILYSEKLDKYYVGACIDMNRRLYEHNIGHSAFTSRGIPWILKYTEEFSTLTEAKKRESYIKKMKSRKYIESLLS